MGFGAEDEEEQEEEEEDGTAGYVDELDAVDERREDDEDGPATDLESVEKDDFFVKLPGMLLADSLLLPLLPIALL